LQAYSQDVGGPRRNAASKAESHENLEQGCSSHVAIHPIKLPALSTRQRDKQMPANLAAFGA
jgi:hypothetical protein